MNTTIKVLTLAIALAAASPGDLYANTASPVLLRASAAKINAANDYGYNMLLKSRKADSIMPVGINPEAITENTETISLGLQGMGKLAHKLSVEKTLSGSIVWRGTFGRRVTAGDFAKARLTGEIAVDPMNFIELTRHKDAVVGTMRYNGDSYELAPTSKGFAFFKVSASSEAYCAQNGPSRSGGPTMRRELITLKTLPASLDFSTKAVTVYTSVVLFAFTTDAFAAIGKSTNNAIAAVNAMLAKSNRIMSNSVYTAQLQTPGIIFLSNYNSSSSSSTDLTNLRTSTHPDMVAFRDAKTRTRADIGVLIGTNGVGIATVRPAGVDRSNVVTPNNALVFAHEIGHIYGGGHQPGAGDGSTSYAHGYSKETGTYPFRTIMHTSLGSRTIDYFSNVSLRYQNQVMGNSNQNNAYTVQANAAHIAGLAN